MAKRKKPITYTTVPHEVIRQKHWTEAELRAMGYEYYHRLKEVTMVRQLPEREAPMRIQTRHGDALIAQAGYMICYEPGLTLRERLNDYKHWPVEPEIFDQTYLLWDEDNWEPSPASRHLMSLGCRPFYKATGIWARKLEDDVYVQSKEHVEPVKVGTGMYIAIGQDGEPYTMGDITIHSRYRSENNPPPEKKTILGVIKRLLGL